MNFRVLSLSILGLVALSGCESAGLAEYNPFRSYADQVNSSASTQNVDLRYDEGAVTPLPNQYAGNASLGNSSVEIFDGQVNPQYSRGVSPSGSLPQYGGGVLASSDSSVTVFSLDGAPVGGAQNFSGNGFSAPQNFGAASNAGGNQIFFKHGSSRLGGGDKRVLSSVAEQAKFAPVNRITVAGHASQPTQAGSRSVEGHILNLKESMNRSFAVSKELMRNGVPAEKIKTVSWGSTKPTGNNTQDRRVDIVMGEQ